MKARLAHRHRLFTLVDRRAQETFISTAPIALYSAAMSQLATDRQGQASLLRTAIAALHAHLCRSSILRRQFLDATGELKLHSLSVRGFVQPGLSAIRHQPASAEA